jgi:hypothetical protein
MTEDKAFMSFFPPGTETDEELIRHGQEAGFQSWKIRFISAAGTAARWARWGDWKRLTDYVANGGRITSEKRKFLAAVLRREVRKPNNRAASFAGSAGVDGALKSVLFVLSLEQELGRRGATSAAARKFNMSRRSIQQALVKAEAAAKLLIQLRDLQLKTCSSVPRYVVSPTASTPHFMP